MRSPKISVVVPVYNIAAYLPKLVDSVCRQTVEDFELLVVDNNSTDDVWAYMQQAAARDARILPLKQPKQGVGAARNLGLEHARGTYVIFLDGDDSVEPDLFASMLALVDTPSAQADMAMCGYVTEYQGEVVGKTAVDGPEQMTREEFLCELYEDDTIDYQGFIWDKLFRRELIEEHQIRFREDISFNEDRLFITQYMLYAKDVAVIPRHLYHYRVREDSAMGMGRKYYASEAEMTELVAFDEIVRLIAPYPKACALAKRNMAIAQIRLFKRMLDKRHFLRYRKSILRRFARRFQSLGYQPKDYNEKVICQKYILYGYTGISFGVVDTRNL